MSRQVLLICVMTALLPSVGWAESAGDACGILAKLDQNVLQYSDEEYHATINYRENKKLVKNFNLRVVLKGSHKVLVSFLAPGEMRGTRVLVADAETMYTYMPDYGRIRRVAGHSRRQSFMGTNMYYEDITERRLSKRWACTPVETTESHWVFDLRIKPGSTSAYSKLRVKVGRQREEIEHIDYYEETRHVKSQERSDWKVLGGVGRYATIRFVSHDRDADLSVEYTQWRANVGIPDSAFTQRALLRGF
jgi:outer membrane lipoprotein-sorting protein